jgi:hypothetical protein
MLQMQQVIRLFCYIHCTVLNSYLYKLVYGKMKFEHLSLLKTGLQ